MAPLWRTLPQVKNGNTGDHQSRGEGAIENMMLRASPPTLVVSGVPVLDLGRDSPRGCRGAPGQLTAVSKKCLVKTFSKFCLRP